MGQPRAFGLVRHAFDEFVCVCVVVDISDLIVFDHGTQKVDKLDHGMDALRVKSAVASTKLNGSFQSEVDFGGMLMPNKGVGQMVDLELVPGIPL